jgi:Zn-dependent protease
MFWLISAILGWNLTLRPVLPGNGLGDLAVWIFAALISILLHELGHVWMGQLFGSHGHIVLHGMGGLAIGSNDLPQRWQRILVSAAGPGIQLLFYGAIWAVLLAGYVPDQNSAARLFVVLLLYINLFWPILNLLPIWPLDGGMITRELCEWGSPRQGLLISLWISLIVGGTLALNAFLPPASSFMTDANIDTIFPGLRAWLGGISIQTYVPKGMWIGVFFAFFAYEAWQGIRAEQDRQTQGYDDRLPWQR